MKEDATTDCAMNNASASASAADCVMMEDSALPCHELLVEYSSFLSSAKFWVHGVGVGLVGVVGLAGNVLTFVALGPVKAKKTKAAVVVNAANEGPGGRAMKKMVTHSAGQYH